MTIIDNREYQHWLDASLGIQYIEMLLLHEVQGLGVLDVELLKELPTLKIGTMINNEQFRVARYHTLSKLWVIGVYETIQVIKSMTKNKSFLKEDTIQEISKAFTLFTKIRVPLAKFQKSAGKRQPLYSAVPDSFIDPIKGMAWKVYTPNKREIRKEVFYRTELAEAFLEMLRKITRDVGAKYYPAQ